MLPSIYDLGFSFFSFQRARRPTPETLTTVEGLVTAEVPETWDKLTLEAHTGDITLRLALATETGEEDLVVLVDEVQATIVGDWSHVRQRLALKTTTHFGGFLPSRNLVEGVVVPKAVTFLPFLMSWTLTHFRIACPIVLALMLVGNRKEVEIEVGIV